MNLDDITNRHIKQVSKYHFLLSVLGPGDILVLENIPTEMGRTSGYVFQKHVNMGEKAMISGLVS